MKTFVWVSTTWVQHTIGTTGILLAHGWGRAVEIVQVAVLLALYAGIACRDPPGTAAAALDGARVVRVQHDDAVAGDLFVFRRVGAARLRRSGRDPRGANAAPRDHLDRAGRRLAAAVAIAALVTLPVNAAIDAGTEADRPYLYSGFSNDEREGDGDVRVGQRHPGGDADPPPIETRRHHRHRLRAASADARRRAAAQRLAERHGDRHRDAGGRLAACRAPGAWTRLADRRQRADAVPVLGGVAERARAE